MFRIGNTGLKSWFANGLKTFGFFCITMVQEDDGVLSFYCATVVQNRMPVTEQPVLLNWVQQKAISKFNKHA